MPTPPTPSEALDLIRLWTAVYDHSPTGRAAPDESRAAVEQAIQVLAGQIEPVAATS